MSEQQDVREQERSNIRWQMAVQHQVDLFMNNMISGMVTLTDNHQVARSQLEKHQIKNLLAVALATSSVEVVINYIRYQVGRDVSGEGWRRGNFGETLANVLHDLRKKAESIADEVHRSLRLKEELSETQIDQTWMLLVRAYLGQFNRYFYYKKEETRWAQPTR